jgi:hypothetical protein
VILAVHKKAIRLTMRAGPGKVFKAEEGKPNPTVRFEGQFVIVTDAYGRLNAFSASDVSKVEEYYPGDELLD